MVNLICSNTFTLWSLIIGFLGLFTQSSHIKRCSILFLITTGIVGMLLVHFHFDKITRYCEVSDTSLKFLNILTHIIFPVLLLYLLFKTKVRMAGSSIKSFGLALCIGLLYCILAANRLACSYGLTFKQYMSWVVAWLTVFLVTDKIIG